MSVRNYRLSGLSTSYHTHPCFTLSEKPNKKTRLLSLSTSKCLVSCICTACLSSAVRAIQPSFSYITVCLPFHLWAVFLSVRKRLADNAEIVDYLLPQIKLEKGEINLERLSWIWQEDSLHKHERSTRKRTDTCHLVEDTARQQGKEGIGLLSPAKKPPPVRLYKPS